MIDVEFPKISQRQIEKQLDRLAAMSGLTVQQIGYETMRLAGNNAIKYTFPRKKGEGKAAIASDANALFLVQDRSGKVWETADGRGWVKLESGAVIATKGIGGTSTVGNAIEARRAMNAQRSRATGRIAKGPRRTRIFAAKRDVAAAIRHKAKRVGQMKAGWLPGAEYWARLARGVVKAPAWVMAQSRKQGKAVGSISKIGTGEIGIDNDVPYMRGGDKLQMLVIVRNFMNRDIMHGFKKRLPRLVERFNKSGSAVAS